MRPFRVKVFDSWNSQGQTASEMRIYIKKILNAVTTTGFLKCHLFKNGTYPDSGHTKTFQIADFAFKPFQRTTGKFTTK